MKLVKLVAFLVAVTAACSPTAWKRGDAMRGGEPEPLGEDRLSLRWKFTTADRLTEVEPQEFSAAAVYADTVYIGSASGWFFALRSSNGAVRWRKRLGAVASAPISVAGVLYIGCADG